MITVDLQAGERAILPGQTALLQRLQLVEGSVELL
jgi:hypothetical protein